MQKLKKKPTNKQTNKNKKQNKGKKTNKQTNKQNKTKQKNKQIKPEAFGSRASLNYYRHRVSEVKFCTRHKQCSNLGKINGCPTDSQVTISGRPSKFLVVRILGTR